MTEPATSDDPIGFICGHEPAERGVRVPLRTVLTDFGFGFCGVYVTGLYGQEEEQLFCTFSAFGGSAWRPDEVVGNRTLGWLERRLRTWDKVWPDAKWQISIVGPWHSEAWKREQPGQWVVTKSSHTGAAG